MSPTKEKPNLKKENSPKKFSKREFFRLFGTALIAFPATSCANEADAAVIERFINATPRITAESLEEITITPEILEFQIEIVVSEDPETQTEIVIPEATAASPEPPEKPTETATEIPPATATPEMKEPVIDFDWEEFIESMPISAESKDYLRRDIENQFDEGLWESDGAYVLRGITRGEMVIYDSGEGLPSDQPLVLPTGHEIPATFKCAFVIKGPNGELIETEVQIPIWVYHPEELTHLILGAKIKLDNVSEDLIKSRKMGLAQKWAGTMKRLEGGVGLAYPNQVVLLDLAIPEGTEFDHLSGQGYLNEDMQGMYNQGQLDEFARTGVWPFVFETPTGEWINLALPVDVNVCDHLYP